MRRINHFIIAFYILISFCYPLRLLNAQSLNNNTENKIIGEAVSITNSVEPELFPVIAKLLSEGNEKYKEYSLVKWNLENLSSDSIAITLSADIPEWVTPAITPVILGPGEKKKVLQNPFGNKLLATNHPIVPTTIVLNAKIGDQVIYEETKNVKIRPADDMIWSMSYPWDMCELIAAWVTPNDEKVESILTIAKDRLYNHTLAGYNSHNVMKEIREIFNAVRNYKISYVDSRISFGKIGETERVRLPKESISQKSANCIDGAVLFASLFENIGLEPLIVVTPEHAFVGVRTTPNSNEALYIETTIVGRSYWESIRDFQNTFDAAVEQGINNYYRAVQNGPANFRIIDIKKARSEGIYPLW